MSSIKAWAQANTKTAAGVLIIALLAGFLVLRQLRSGTNAYEPERLTELVTIRCSETGEEWEMPRGRMEQLLWDRPAPIDPKIGLVNPKTGKPTGFPVSEWEATCIRINRDRSADVKAAADSKGAK